MLDDNGWLSSGDIGIVYPNGSVKIIDRVKNIFKLSQGEYIAPEKLENVYIQSDFLRQIFVYGDSLQSWLIAIGVVEADYVKKWATSKGIAAEKIEELASHQDLQKAVLEDLLSLAKANKFSGLEKIKRIYLTSDEFTI